MQGRRARAERAFRDARECVFACAAAPSSVRTQQLRQCSATARSAAESALELPEHDGPQLELQAALDELVSALDSGDESRLSSASERAARAGSALGWRVGHTPLH